MGLIELKMVSLDAWDECEFSKARVQDSKNQIINGRFVTRKRLLENMK